MFSLFPLVSIFHPESCTQYETSNITMYIQYDSYCMILIFGRRYSQIRPILNTCLTIDLGVLQKKSTVWLIIHLKATNRTFNYYSITTRSFKNVLLLKIYLIYLYFITSVYEALNFRDLAMRTLNYLQIFCILSASLGMV